MVVVVVDFVRVLVLAHLGRPVYKGPLNGCRCCRLCESSGAGSPGSSSI